MVKCSDSELLEAIHKKKKKRKPSKKKDFVAPVEVVELPAMPPEVLKTGEVFEMPVEAQKEVKVTIALIEA